MAVNKPDEYRHNNPDNAFVDSDFVKGGGRVVADLTALYALAPKAGSLGQLKERVTKVWVTAENKYYILTDINNVGNSGGWTVESTASYYNHSQGVSASTWTITHNLGYYPNVQVVDSGGTNVIGDITYNSINQLTITFSASFSGNAYLS